jgi:hypothetical protein
MRHGWFRYPFLKGSLRRRLRGSFQGSVGQHLRDLSDDTLGVPFGIS